VSYRHITLKLEPVQAALLLAAARDGIKAWTADPTKSPQNVVDADAGARELHDALVAVLHRVMGRSTGAVL